MNSQRIRAVIVTSERALFLPDPFGASVPAISDIRFRTAAAKLRNTLSETYDGTPQSAKTTAKACPQGPMQEDTRALATNLNVTLSDGVTKGDFDKLAAVAAPAWRLNNVTTLGTNSTERPQKCSKFWRCAKT